LALFCKVLLHGVISTLGLAASAGDIKNLTDWQGGCTSGNHATH